MEKLWTQTGQSRHAKDMGEWGFRAEGERLHGGTCLLAHRRREVNEVKMTVQEQESHPPRGLPFPPTYEMGLSAETKMTGTLVGDLQER